MARLVTALFIAVGVAGVAAYSQPASDPVRDGITAMRAINTAENMVRNSSGRYGTLPDLLAHPAMERLRADFTVSGGAIAYRGLQVRIALSPDSQQYQAMVVPSERCGTAVFSDESGLIYTGKGLGC